ncbi:MAG: GH3 auxin-responsive promoter family protein [Rikenellaceae bacterium]
MFSTLAQLVRLNSILRLKQIDEFRRYPAQIQKEQFEKLMEVASKTCFGKDHGLSETTRAQQFRNQVPIRSYEDLTPYIDKARAGESNILWKGKTDWFAKSSGTTSSRSKFVPVTADGLDTMHIQGPKDVMAIHYNNFPENSSLDGCTLTLGGSNNLDDMGSGARSGDLSSILIEEAPWWTALKRQPDTKTALIADFDTKVEAICKKVTKINVTSFAGVPSWNMVMMQRILEYTGASNLLEVWPNMELFIHGGMNFNPYREQYKQLIPSSNMHYIETYNASEGFFAIQDDPNRTDMLLMLDYDMYYEFLPMDSFSDHSSVVPLEGVELGRNYAIIISNSCGLWRYMIGDTVEFTSTFPYRIRITGRTKLFINAFGEEIIIDNAEEAMHKACQVTDSQILEYTGAPIYMQGDTNGSHQWLVEFSRPPKDVALFRTTLDLTLQEINSDYAAKRNNDTTLLMPTLSIAPSGTFMKWLASQGKSGGQNKVPRLYNSRKYIDALLAIAEENHSNL